MPKKYYCDCKKGFNRWEYYKKHRLNCNYNIKLNFNNSSNKSDNAILYFHQGWTDIFNSLALINYYCNIYKHIFLVIREDSKKIIDFYTKNLNVTNCYFDKNNLDNLNLVHNLEKKIKNINTMDYLGIGLLDNYRNDTYDNIFYKYKCYFVKKFYIPYNIPYITRINNFIFNRNLELENQKYNDFVNTHGDKFILIHQDRPRNILIEQFIDNNNNNYKIINLNNTTEIFFDMIKILEKSIEIHLIDSVWGAFIYLLDAKYNLFKNKNIYLYPLRGHTEMFIDPIKLKNWKIVNNT